MKPGRYRLIADYEYIVEVHEDGYFTRLSAPRDFQIGVKTPYRFGGSPSSWVKVSPDDPYAETDF